MKNAVTKRMATPAPLTYNLSPVDSLHSAAPHRMIPTTGSNARSRSVSFFGFGSSGVSFGFGLNATTRPNSTKAIRKTPPTHINTSQKADQPEAARRTKATTLSTSPINAPMFFAQEGKPFVTLRQYGIEIGLRR